jgi:hypothetical protein
VYTRISGVLDWIHETICKLTDDDPSDLPFTCPDFVCPADAVVFGLSNLKVPSAIGRARSFNGFAPSTIVQTPAAGSPLPYGADTLVDVTATDPTTGTSITCTWKVTVPEQDVVGAVAVRIRRGKKRRRGTTTRNALFVDSLAPGVVQEAGMYVLSGSLDAGGPGGPRQADGVVRGQLRAGPNFAAPILTLKGSTADDPGASVVLQRRVPFTYRSNLRVLVTAQNVPRTVVVLYFVYGQQQR